MANITKKREKISKAKQNLQFLQKGSDLVKVRGKNSTYNRFFTLDKEGLFFAYSGSKKFIRFRKFLNYEPDQSKVFITEVQEIRSGASSDVFVKSFHRLGADENQCFTVVAGEKHKTLDLVAPDKATRDKWVNGLSHLRKKVNEADLATQQEIWMREIFRMADKNNDGALCLKEVINLLKNLNMEVDLEAAKEVFQEMDFNKAKNKKGEDCLNPDEFVAFYRQITRREEVEELFEEYNYEGKYLDIQELQDFFRIEQQQVLNFEECLNLIAEFEQCPNVKSQKMMSIDGFYIMLNSPLMDVFNPKHRNITHDMTKPMSHYFIDSSHNTYLTRDQLRGPSSQEAYIRALKNGCRGLELDCWDGDKGEPVIYHGYTLTSKILFRDAIASINAYAFKASEYPLILSIENHCSVEQQRVMADIMKCTFGNKLYTEPLADDITELPSPEQLKGRIIVKAKKLPDLVDDDGDGYVSDEDEAEEMEGEEVTDEIKEQLDHSKKSSKQKVSLAKSLSDCVIICQSVSFKGFSHAQKSYNFKQMSSYSEKKAFGLLGDESGAWLKHNLRQFSRIYPAGWRTDSSNYDPMPMWVSGNQIVALNYQTPDEPMHINKGMFLDNGTCGYVLKPDFMTDQDKLFRPMGSYPSSWQKNVKITVISGYQLPKKKGDRTKSILDPYVKIDIVGVAVDTASKKTDVINNNGFHPVWEETLEFTVNVPDLALVYFKVIDYQRGSGNVLVAQYCLPFRCLQPGYRTIHLKSKYGEPILGSNLFIKTVIT